MVPCRLARAQYDAEFTHLNRGVRVDLKIVHFVQSCAHCGISCANFSVARNSPGLFGQSMNSQVYAIALHADGSLITPDSPAQGGENISLLGTGFGPYATKVIDEFFPPVPPPALADTVTVSVSLICPFFNCS